LKVVQLGWLDGFAMAVDGGNATQTQQPTADLDRGRIEQVFVASSRGKGYKNTTIRRKRGLMWIHNYFVMLVICITLKLNHITA
jgi:hypothetical protein